MPSPGGVPEHLWIVITERDTNNKAVCVNVTDEAYHFDKTTILETGDHSYIKKCSVIRYQKGQVFDLSMIEAAFLGGLGGKVCAQHKPCSQTLLKRVQDGVNLSAQSPKEIKAFFPKLALALPSNEV
jgi:hypothetical protein